MANKRIDQLNLNLGVLTGDEIIPIFDTSTNTTERITINTLSEFIDKDIFTTGTTLSGNTIIFDRNDLNNAYSVDLTPALSGFSTTDYFVTGGTYNSLTQNIDFNGNSGFNPFSVDVSQFIKLPPNPTTGDTLVFNGTEWVSGSIGGGYTYEIGEYVPSEGGVIFHRYLEGTIENYLVTPIVDQSINQVWSNVTAVEIGSIAQSSWDGLSNSNAIVSQIGHTNSAASLCLNLVIGGQNDWYLPSLDELSLLWHNRFNVNKTLSSVVGATVLPNPVSASYWSSTESSATFAWRFSFNSGSTGFTLKSNAGFVRAVRTFTI